MLIVSHTSMLHLNMLDWSHLVLSTGDVGPKTGYCGHKIPTFWEF